MATSARLESTAVEVVPGAVSQVRVRVVNHGSIVEGYTLAVVGDLAAYASVEPPTLSLYPEAEGVATVTLAVPRGAPVQAGEVPFAVMVQPHEHPADVAVPEGVARVAAYDDLTAELTPRTSHGRRRVRHQLAVDNRGNHPVSLALTGWDPDDAVDFHFRPPVLQVGPGQAAFASVGLSAVERIWRGAPATHQFRVTAAVDEETPGTEAPPAAAVEGVMVQDPTLPPWTGRALLAATAALVGLAVLWYAALRPVIETTAEDAAEDVVAERVQQLSKDVSAARQEAAQAQVAAGEAEQAATKAEGSAGSAANSAQTTQSVALGQQVAAGQPFSRRLSVEAGPDGTDSASYQVGDEQLLRVTDLVFESPGDVGRLQVLRGDQVLLSLQPQNFRDLDQHFVSPIFFAEGERLIVRLECATPAAGADNCQEAVYVGGSLASTATPSPSPTAGAG